MPTTEKPGLTRDAIKYLAIFASESYRQRVSAGKHDPVGSVYRHWLLHSHYHVLFSCGRLLLYTFQEKIWRKTSDLCRNLPGSLYDSLWEFTAEYDLYSVYLFYDPGCSGKDDGK